MTSKKKYLILVLTASIVAIVTILSGGCKVRRPEAQSADELCVHEWNAGEVTREPTCMEEGEFTKTCVLCQATITDSLEMVGHTPVEMQEVLPTCEQVGLTGGTQCDVCGIVLTSQEIVPATGHMVVVDMQVQPTCEAEGKTEGAHCSICEKVLLAQEDIPTLPHELMQISAYAATCETDGHTGGEYCVNCDVIATGEVIPALGHLWSEYTYTQAKCDEERYGLHTCLREGCGKKEAFTFPPIGHNLNEGTVANAATCTKEGLLIKQCVNEGCGIYWSETIPMLAHSYVNGVCGVCGQAMESQISFTINGETLYAEENMTWADWVESDWNIINATTYESGAYPGTYYLMIGASDVLQNPGNPLLINSE